MNYATIKKCDVANGPGVRVSLFVSGCTHNCKNCFNKVAQDFNYGKCFNEQTQEEILEALKPDYIKGLSLLGGEPLEKVNQRALLPLIKKVKETYPNKSIWCYSGYTFENQILTGKANDNEVTKEILENVDYLVDGEYVDELRNPGLKFRGSSNQRIIDVQSSLKNGKVELWDEQD